MRRSFFFILIFALLVSCATKIKSDRQKAIKKYSENFYSKQNFFDTLAQKVLNDNYIKSKFGQYVYTYKLSGQLQKDLDSLGIESVTIQASTCSRKSVEFTTNWTEYPVGKMYLTKDFCDTTTSEKGHYTISHFIETW